MRDVGGWGMKYDWLLFEERDEDKSYGQLPLYRHHRGLDSAPVRSTAAYGGAYVRGSRSGRSPEGMRSDRDRIHARV